jgi:hypothetical protein
MFIKVSFPIIVLAVSQCAAQVKHNSEIIGSKFALAELLRVE